MDFDIGRDKRKKSFEIRILNTGEIVKNMGDLVLSAGLLLQEGENT